MHSPEEYQRYVEMREARIKALTRRKERNYKIALASCEVTPNPEPRTPNLEPESRTPNPEARQSTAHHAYAGNQELAHSTAHHAYAGNQELAQTLLTNRPRELMSRIARALCARNRPRYRWTSTWE